MEEPRQFGQRRDDVRCLRDQPAAERGGADLFLHPALEKGLGGGPQIELRIELAPESLDVQQRLLQQDELGLDLDRESPRRAEELHQHAAERDLRQRPIEYRFQDDADFRLELVDARAGRHPSRLEVRGGHAMVVAAEEREEVLREIALVALGQRAHDAEVHRDVLAEIGGIGRNEDVSGMHVRVEIAVAKNLRKKKLDPGAGESL